MDNKYDRITVVSVISTVIGIVIGVIVSLVMKCTACGILIATLSPGAGLLYELIRKK